MDRSRALAARVFANAAPVERALLDAVLARFDADRAEYSDILEWSLSGNAGRVDTARFSYAFPGWASTRRRGSVARTVEAWGRIMGVGAASAARSVLHAARSPTVEQVLVGYARDAGDRPRAKFYLQFRSDAGAAARELARSLTGLRAATSSDALPLHLLGLDVGRSGLQGAKLYFVRDQLDAGALRAALPGWSHPLRNALLIHRLDAPDDPGALEPAEIDFALDENALDWRGLADSPALAPHAAARDAFDNLAADFRLRARRVSFDLAGRPKINVYYVLDEADPISRSNPPGGG